MALTGREVAAVKHASTTGKFHDVQGGGDRAGSSSRSGRINRRKSSRNMRTRTNTSSSSVRTGSRSNSNSNSTIPSTASSSSSSSRGDGGRGRSIARALQRLLLPYKKEAGRGREKEEKREGKERKKKGAFSTGLKACCLFLNPFVVMSCPRQGTSLFRFLVLELTILVFWPFFSSYSPSGASLPATG